MKKIKNLHKKRLVHDDENENLNLKNHKRTPKKNQPRGHKAPLQPLPPALASAPLALAVSSLDRPLPVVSSGRPRNGVGRDERWLVRPFAGGPAGRAGADSTAGFRPGNPVLWARLNHRPDDGPGSYCGRIHLFFFFFT